MSERRGSVQLTLRLPMSVEREGDWFFASIPVLDVVSQGRSYDEAKLNLAEAVRLFIESCLERRVLDDVLLDCGFAVDAQPDEDSDGDILEMTLPLLARRHAEARPY